jgi:hypothetical protein
MPSIRDSASSTSLSLAALLSLASLQQPQNLCNTIVVASRNLPNALATYSGHSELHY